MKKFVLLLGFGILVSSLSAQVFNTGQTLKKGKLAIGFEPMIVAQGGSDFILFGHVGYGLQKGIDINGKVGILSGDPYVGGDVEFALNKNVSIGGGAHVWVDFGLDATLLGTYSPASNVNLFGGLDVDMVIGGNVFFPIWIPVGVEVELKKNMAFIFEASIGVVDAPHLIGGGLIVYF